MIVTANGAFDVGISRRLQLWMLVTDFAVVALATFVAFSTRFSVSEIESSLAGPLQLVGTLIPFLWVALLVLVGAYDQRVLGLGLSEYGRVLKSALWVLAAVSIVSFLGKFDTSRAYVLIAIPLGLVGLLIERWLWRRLILRTRRKGKALEPTIVIGDEEDREKVVTAFTERSWAGYRVVQELEPYRANGDARARSLWIDQTLNAIDRNDAACLALTASSGLTSADIRELSWRLEGRSVDLLISSSLGAVVGPRLSLRVATGLPFLHLDEVGLSFSQRLLKRALDISGSVVALILLSPLLLVIALAVLVGSGRPVLFRQERAGLDGRYFRMWKFRTMRQGADSEREQLRSQAESTGATFKVSDDPRVTGVGKFLRRWSLDELPQLFNVVAGDMSLVGPRPHPADDVERYREGDTRRLRAKPGMTGLWQVAGRSDVSWDDAVELDLLYIENWSLLGDLAILARTVQAVIAKSGAY